MYVCTRKRLKFSRKLICFRGKLCDELEEFILEDDRNSFSLKLEDGENWLYEDGEFAEKNEYQVSILRQPATEALNVAHPSEVG